ncbi:MAG: hypothetical protein IJ088_15400 [Clostridia bacterium]|nr:hypothetical protein [Clostridia bacterium]
MEKSQCPANERDKFRDARPDIDTQSEICLKAVGPGNREGTFHVARAFGIV